MTNVSDSTYASAPRLLRRNGRLMAQGSGDAEPWPAVLLHAAPLSRPDGPLSVADEKKVERALLPSVAAFDPESRALAEEELRLRYVRPLIRRVLRTSSGRGERTVEVETDRGPRAFALHDPHRNTQWVDDDRLLLTDVAGNRYEVPSWRALDPASRRLLARVL